MTELKKLFLESFYYHQDAEVELGLKCVKEWLEDKHTALVKLNQNSWNERADRTHHQALLIEDLLEEIGFPELKAGRTATSNRQPTQEDK